MRKLNVTGEQHVLDGKEYEECTLCPASCPSRDAFKRARFRSSSQNAICKSDPPLEKPMCRSLHVGALTYGRRKRRGNTGIKTGRNPGETGRDEDWLEMLIKKYGFRNVADTVARMGKKGR